MYSFYQVWGWRLMLEDYACYPSYSQFRLAWLAYLELITMKDTWFQCPKCGVYPEIVICDGICLSYPKRFSQEHVGTNSDDGCAVPLKGSR
jgi:hypothetical protein